MKKIALLFTILGVGALSGMEVPPKSIPDDVKAVIITTVSNSKSINEAVDKIVKDSIHNKGLRQILDYTNNPQAFMSLVNMLAKRYDTPSADVAELFKR